MARLKLEWEDLGIAKRAAVHGGWLVRTTFVSEENGSVAICFVPDWNHVWGTIPLRTPADLAADCEQADQSEP